MAKKELGPPKGYFKTAKDWLKASNMDVKQFIKEFHFDRPVRLKEPVGLTKVPPAKIAFSSDPSRKKQRHGIVTILPKARMYGKKANVITSDNKLIWKFSSERDRKPEEHSIFQLKKLPPVQKSAKTVLRLVNEVGGAYFHWMLDVLPCLHLVSKCGIKPDLVVISGKRVEPFQLETLEAFGIPRKKVVISHENMHVKAERLIIPKMSSGLRPKWVCDFVRKQLVERKKLKPKKGYERVYISRSKAHTRKVLNEKEVMAVLSKYGFKSVVLEKLPIKEQLRIFLTAKYIAGPHGSGFTNMIFSRRGTKIIEFFSPSYIHDCYPRLSSIMRHRHYFLVADKPVGDDIIVNMKKLDKMLKLTGLK